MDQVELRIQLQGLSQQQPGIGGVPHRGIHRAGLVQQPCILGAQPQRLVDLGDRLVGPANLQTGIHPRVVQERLGHSNIAITLQTYSHVLPTMHDDAAVSVAALFMPGGGLARCRSPVSRTSGCGYCCEFGADRTI